MDLETINEKVYNNEYTVKLEYPKRPEGYKKENYVYDENQTVKWNREHQEELANKYQEELQKYHNVANQMETQFVNDLIEALMTNYKFTEVQAKNIYKKAWEEGHADGLSAVIGFAIDFADFTKSQLNNEQYTY